MQRFDCLSLDCPLLGPHLLEASAGTGKTFSIEHVVVRLVLEGFEIEQILAVTFTKAAAREMKMRIRSNLEKALQMVEGGNAAWAYLGVHIQSPEAISRLKDALSGFDRCQIFTIHGFCYRMLQECAFEAKVGFVADPEQQEVPPRLRQTFWDFLDHAIDPQLVCPEQLALLIKEFRSFQDLEETFLEMKEVAGCESFAEISAKCKAALHPWNLEEDKLLSDFEAASKNYKKIKGDFLLQVCALAKGEIGPLIKERGSLFALFQPSNRKVRAQEVFLHYPGFFEWASEQLSPLVNQDVRGLLQAAWNRIGEKILEEEHHFGFDALLLHMQKMVKDFAFTQSIRKKYRAAIIDEFQDTDAVQWDIFETLFLKPPLDAVYLVGDPKQAIYRFRKADIYTYLKARSSLGREHLYHLDTNFRCAKPLVSALNALFSRDWIYLPKEKTSLPYHPVQAGADIETPFHDGKGAIHLWAASGEAKERFQDCFLPAAVAEIEKLATRKCAILVKDRHQASMAVDLLKKRGIPVVAKSHVPLKNTVAFQAIRELFTAIVYPKDANATRVVQAGPFASIVLSEARVWLEENGLVGLVRKLELDADGMQIFEILFELERKEGFSFQGLLRFFTQFDDQTRRMEVNTEAVQVMTMHISKGLEFDVVFALGLMARTPEGDEELDAEKLRQLYVAMTRAKMRLYIPFIESEEADKGKHAPMELFAKHFKETFLQAWKMLGETESVTWEMLDAPVVLPKAEPAALEAKAPPLSPRPAAPIWLTSFTALAKTQEGKEMLISDPAILPRGPETGIVIHKIFEEFFKASCQGLEQILDKELRFSKLSAWRNEISDMVMQAVSTSLGSFCLKEIRKFQTEVPFLFPSPPNYIQGYIDLLFEHENKIYLLDWKTNWLEEYTPAAMQGAILQHDYNLQASLYKEAVERHFKMRCAGAYYFFVRGGTYVIL